MEIAETSVMEPEGRTDQANARRFAHEHGLNVRYCHPWRKWLVWDGCRWRADNTGRVMRLAKSTADSIWNDARSIDSREALKHATYSAGDRGAKCLLSQAESEVPILPDALDKSRWLLNCPNGTVDLRTGELKPHLREDYITRLCPVNYYPEADSTVWDEFIRQVFDGSQELIEFVRRLLGYAATGDVREQILPIFWGGGSNGKSTLLEAVTSTLGEDYCGAAPDSLLLTKNSDSHPTELASLYGKHLAIATETNDGRRLNEAIVKKLTGGDRISTRRMREDFWSFAATHKIVLMTNHKPQVRGTDHAIWRRLKLVPFNVRFDGPRKDPTMPARLEKQRAGILRWIVSGAVDWYRHGLTDPEAVRIATSAYRSESDVIGRFLDESCETGADLKVKSSDLYGAMNEWCKDTGESLPNRKVFGESIRERGFEHRKSGSHWYLGIRLLDDLDRLDRWT